MALASSQVAAWLRALLLMAVVALPGGSEPELAMTAGEPPWLSPDWPAMVREFRGQRRVPEAVPNLERSPYLRRCPAGCKGGGDCNLYTGSCQCRLGRRGPACEEHDEYPCNNADGIWTLSACFGKCVYGRCYCGPGTKYPHRPAAHVAFKEVEDMWRAAAAEGNATLLKMWGIDAGAEPRMEWVRHGQASREEAHDWCNKRHPAKRFGCVYPENPLRGGECSASQQAASICLNQCSGNGQCHRGMCHCRPGWHGVDCSLQHPATGKAAVAARLRPGSSAFLGNRRRPRIFVYELPATFNSRLLQFRRRGICTTREMDTAGPEFNTWLYNADFLLLEWLLHSEFRTADPAEADFFFVPFLTSCYTFLGDDHPRHRVQYGCRAIATAQAAKLVLQHIRGTYPFWDRRNGSDHLWLWAWDEGACLAPTAIRNAIMLSHWGGKYWDPRTAYGPDNWLRPDLPWTAANSGPFGMAFQDVPVGYDKDHHLFDSRGVRWAGHYEERGGVDCYDPDKDIVLPAPYFEWLRSPTSLYRRALAGKLGAPGYNSDTLFYFAGDLGHAAHKRAGQPGGRVEFHYSRGVRQNLSAIFDTEEWKSRGVHLWAGKRERYFEEMSASVFCGALPGDGWSNAYAYAIQHGCIPVLIMDDVDLAWGTVLDYSRFSIRVPEADMARLYDILAAVPPEEVARMQAALRAIWPRFTYYRYRLDMERRLKALGADTRHMRSQMPDPREADSLGDDALDTLMQALYAKLKAREAAEAGARAAR